MKKADLINTLSATAKMTKKDAGSILDKVLFLIVEGVANSGEVTLPGFGKFEKVERAERDARNPYTGESVHVPAKNTIKFRPGADFKKAVE